MDYHSMKRRELQALCKEHDIPASSANSVLADKLSALLNKPTSRQRTCMKSAVETTDESEPAVLRRQAKKVRFSPNNDLVEYELRSSKKEDMVTETKTRRKSVVKKVAKPVVDNIGTVELADDGPQVPVRVTRSRVQGKNDCIPINEKKQSRRGVKELKKESDEVKELEGNIGKVTRSKVHTLGKGGDAQLDEKKQNKKAVKDVEKASESVEETVVGRVRVTRSKAQTLMEDSNGPNLNPKVKKKSGRRVVNEVDTAEPSKDIMDSPVRVTRSRRQTLTDDATNMVAITQVKKESGRRVVNDVDSIEPSEEIMDVPVRVTRSRGQTLTDDAANNQELPRRKSSRGRGVEIATEDGNEKVGHGKRKKRSEESTAEVSESQHHADKESRQSRRNRVEVEDSTVLNPSVSKVEMVVDRKVTRSKALLATNKAGVQRESKMVQQLEEHMDRPARKDTRRKFVMQKGKGKGIDKPLVEKREMVKETEMVESPKVGTPKTVGKRKSKEQSGNLSESVTKSGKSASENEMKTVDSVTGSHKSKRQRGNPVNEDQTVAAVYVSPVVESTRRSTRSASKTEGKAVSYPRQNFVAGKQQESGIKTPASSSGNELSVESAALEGHQSAAIIKGNSSKRSMKLSESKPSDSEEHVEGLPVSKLENFDLDEKVTETGGTPAVEDSVRRLTRSAVRSERKAAVVTMPGRLTRSGIKHRGNAGSKLSETVDNKKQQSQSTRRRQPLADAQMFSPEVTGVGDHPDVTSSRVSSEINKEAEDQLLERSDDLSVSESARLPTHVTEENRASMSEAPIVMENVTLVSADNASGVSPREVIEGAGADIEKSSVQFSSTENETAAASYLTENLVSGKQQNSVGLPNFEDETPPGTNFSDIIRTPFPTAEVSETMPDVQNENQEVSVKSTPSSEAQVQVAANIDKSVVRSGSPDEYGNETKSTRSGSMSKRLQTDAMVEEPGVSVANFDSSPEVITKGKNGDVDNNCDSISYEAGLSAVCHASFEQSYNKSKSKDVEALPEPSIIEDVEQFVADDGSDAQIEKGYEQEVLTTSEPLQNPSEDKHEVADNDAHNDDDEKASAQKQLFDEYVSEDNGVHGSIDTGSRGVAAVVEAETMDSVLEQSAKKYSSQTPVEVEHDAEANGDVLLEQSTGGDVLQGLAMDENDIKDDMVADQESLAKQSELSIGKSTTYVTDDEVDDEKELKSEEVMPSICSDELQMPILNKSDGEDDTINATKSSETDLMPSTDDNILQDFVLSSGHGEGESVDAHKEHEYNSNLPTDDILETPISGNGIEGECDNAGDALKSYPKPSTGDDLLGTSSMSNNDVEDDSMNVSKELEPDLQPSNTENTLEVLVSGNGDSECVLDDKTDGQDGEAEQDVGDDEPELAQNMELDALFTSSDKEADPVFNVAVDEVPCDNASVGRSDSSTLKETPRTPATNENDITDSIVDIHEDAVSKTLGDFGGPENAKGVTDTKNDISYCESEQKSKESESVSLGVSNEQRTEEAEMSTGVFGDRNEQIITTVDHDLDGDKFNEDCSNHGVDKENILTPENPTREETSPTEYTKEKSTVDDSGPDQFTEVVGVHGSPIPEEFDDAVSDPPNFFKDDGVNKQEETQHASTSADWGNHSSGIDEYQKPVSANESDEVLDEIMKEDRVSDLQTSRQASSCMDKICSPAAGFVNSVTNLEKGSRNEADGKFNHDVVDTLKANANADATDEFLNWSDSSLQRLFTTPTNNRSSDVKHDQEDAVRFTFSDDRSSNDIGIRGSGAHDFHRPWESGAFDDKTQDPATQSNQMDGGPNFDVYFGGEVDGSNNMSVENKKENKP